MEKRKLFYLECNLAGRKYHEANDVWQELFIGIKLQLERERDNKYDPDAIKVVYYDIDGVDYLLGYIPTECNGDLSKFFDMGWGDIFECSISKITPDTHYENQIRLTITILNKHNQ